MSSTWGLSGPLLPDRDQILRRAPVSYLLAAILLILLAIVGVMVATQTAFQLQAGIALAQGEIIGKAASFILLALFAIWLVVRFLRSISGPGGPVGVNPKLGDTPLYQPETVEGGEHHPVNPTLAGMNPIRLFLCPRVRISFQNRARSLASSTEASAMSFANPRSISSLPDSHWRKLS